jgi:hypothetical protein
MGFMADQVSTYDATLDIQLSGWMWCFYRPRRYLARNGRLRLASPRCAVHRPRKGTLDGLLTVIREDAGGH